MITPTDKAASREVAAPDALTMAVEALEGAIRLIRAFHMQPECVGMDEPTNIKECEDALTALRRHMEAGIVVTDEAVIAAAMTVRRRRFERTSALKAYDPSLPLTENELDDARTALASAPASPAPETGWRERAHEYLIWWTNQSDCERIVPLDTWPVYLGKEYSSRLGRNGRGRLWVADEVEKSPHGIAVDWDAGKNWLCRAAGDCAGIVIKGEHLGEVQFLPGFVTTFDMTLPSTSLPSPPHTEERKP